MDDLPNNISHFKVFYNSNLPRVDDMRENVCAG